MSQPFDVVEHKFSDATWVAVRAHGSEWSWMTPDQAVALGHKLIGMFGSNAQIDDANKEFVIRLPLAGRVS